MDKNFIRKATPNEKFYSDMQQNYTCFSMQFIIEATGDINKEDFFNAVKKASDYCPFSKAVLSQDNWINTNKYPKITYLKNFSLDNKNFSNEIFLEKINPHHSCVNFYISKSDKFILIVKIFHGLMDGKGALIYINNIFKFLRNEPLDRANSKINDLSFIKTISKNRVKRNYELKSQLINTGEKTKFTHTYFNRIRLNTVEPFMLPKIVDILSNYYKDKNATFMIPVDIRRHKKSRLITSNMVLPIFLNTDKNDTVETILRKFLLIINNNEELNLENADHGYFKNIPFIFKKKLIDIVKKIGYKTNKFLIGGVLSDLGKIDLEKFSLEGFSVDSFVSLPVQQPVAPISLVLLSGNDNMDLVFSSCTSVLNPTVLNNMILDIEKVFEEKIQRFDFVKEILNQLKISENSIACRDNKNSITYKQLDKQSDYLATYLMSIGIVKQNTVVLYLSRTLDFIISLVAILKLQLKYIPIDKSMPNYLKEEILSGNDFEIVITDCDEVLSTNKTIINLSNINTIDNQPHIDKYKSIVQNTVHKDNNFIVYKIYTSGTTGKSKCVEVNKHNLNNYLLFAKNEYSKNERCNFPLFTSISVDLTVTSIFLPLLTGGSITTFKNNVRNNISKEILEDNEIDCIKMTPSHLKIMCNLNIKQVNKKLVIVGGELFSSSLAKKVKELFLENTIIVNEYGPTEATVGCMYHIVDDNNDEDIVSIGLPIPNTNILIYPDKNEKTGELYITGNSVVREYYKNEAETKSKFIRIKENIYYKTGDLVEFVNGKYICIGRNDRQIKINGHRVELEAIENKINSYEHINSSKIDFLNNILYCTFTANCEIEIIKLKKYSEENLPKHMQPKEFLQVENFEIGANGKADTTKDKKANIEKAKENIKTELTSKEQNIKNKIIKIWNEVLETKITKEDYKTTFYDLGGDSLKLLLLISSTENLFKIENFESKLFDVCLGNYEDLNIDYYFSIILTLEDLKHEKKIYK